MTRSALITLAGFAFLAFCTTVFAADTAMVTQIQGDPMIVRNSIEIAAKSGMTCETNDLFKTTDGCMMDVMLNNKVGCRVLPSSEVLLASTNDQDMHLKINSGNIILNVEKLKTSSFRVETPSAIASVRGTQFWGRVLDPSDPHPSTTFAVREGSIEIYSKALDRSFTVNEGQALDIPKTLSAETSITVRSALADELKAMEQASSVKTSA